MKVSKIGWTDFSGGDLNFVTGCTPVSEGCQNCYARSIYERFGRDFSRVQIHEDKLRRLIKKDFPYHSPKRGLRYKPMAFVCDTGDLFHPDVPDDFITQAFAVMIERADVVWQVLTKRAERMWLLLNSDEFHRRVDYEVWELSRALSVWPVDNVWLGVTAESQRCADERLPFLVQTPAGVRFVSVEPMLGPLDIGYYLPRYDHRPEHAFWQIAHPEDGTRPILTKRGVDWVICGAESGPRRRPFDIQWARDLWVYCNADKVPFFGKQDSGLRPGVPLLIGDGDSVVQEWPDKAQTGTSLYLQEG